MLRGREEGLRIAIAACKQSLILAPRGVFQGGGSRSLVDIALSDPEYGQRLSSNPQCGWTSDVSTNCGLKDAK
jgi:hypothetical protein